MKKKIIKSTIILIFISIITKILSFIVRIYLGRTLTIQAMNYYALAMPTLVFVIALAQMGIPAALSKVIVTSDRKQNVVISACIITFITNTIIIIGFIILIPFLSHMIFQSSDMSSILKSMIYMIPMVSFSGILKGTMQGLQKHELSSISQIFEEVFRIIYLIWAFQSQRNDLQLAEIAMYSVFIGEIGSSLFMLISLLCCDYKIRIKDTIFSFQIIQELLSLSIPMSISRFIGSFTFFLEPLIFLSFSSDPSYSTIYGTFNGYVLPLITMSSFISLTLSSALLPSFTYETYHKNYHRAMKIFKTILCISFMISCFVSIVCFLFPDKLLYFIFKTNQGISLLRQCSLPFAFYALQPILSSILHALNQSRKAMFDTIIGCILRIVILCLTPIFQEHTLMIALISSMLLTTFLHAYNAFISIQNYLSSSKQIHS